MIDITFADVLVAMFVASIAVSLINAYKLRSIWIDLGDD